MSIILPLSVEQTREVSDGYHTFNELYQHRILLYLNLVLNLPGQKAWKPHYPGWPVLFIETIAGQISYHFEEKYLPLIEKQVPRIDDYKWDGHTSEQVLERLTKLLQPIKVEEPGNGPFYDPMYA